MSYENFFYSSNVAKSSRGDISRLDKQNEIFIFSTIDRVLKILKNNPSVRPSVAYISAIFRTILMIIYGIYLM